MRRARIFLLQTFLLLTALGLCIGFSLRQKQVRDRLLPQRQGLTAALGLTDLAIWTEARYTRHPSQADFFTPFQDAPGALEHFPSGSLLAPPMARPQTRIETRRAKR